MTINVCWSCISNSEWRLLYIYISPFPILEEIKITFYGFGKMWMRVFVGQPSFRWCAPYILSWAHFFPFTIPSKKEKKNPEWAIVFLNFSRQSKKWFLNLYARNSRNILNLTKNFLEPKKDSNTSVENNKFYLRFHYYDFTCNTYFYFIFSTCMLALMYDSFFV